MTDMPIHRGSSRFWSICLRCWVLALSVLGPSIPALAEQAATKSAPTHSSTSSTAAVNGASDDTPSTLDAAAIQAQIAIVNARTDIPTQERDLILKQLNAAAVRLEAAQAARAATAGYVAAVQSAPKTIAELNEESTSSPAATALKSTNEDPVQMQLKLATLQTELVSLRGKQRDLEESISNMASRPEAARTELTTLRSQLDQPPAAIPINASPLLIEATNLLNNATRQERSARIDKIEQEQLSLPTRESIATAQRDLLARHIAQVDAAIDALNARIAAQLKSEIDRQVIQAQALALRLEEKPAALRDYASQTAAIRESQKQLAGQLEHVLDAQQKLQAQQNEVADARKNAEQILAIGRIGEESGRLLRDLQANLVAPDVLEERTTQREDMIVDARVQRLQIRQELRALQPEATVGKRYLAEHDVPDTAANLALITTLLAHRRAALLDLDEAQSRYISLLLEDNAVDADLAQNTTKLRTLLGERLLWLPSATPVGRNWIRQLGTGIQWLVAPSNWSQIPSALSSTLQARWLSGFIMLTIVIALFLSRRRLVRSLQTCSLPIGHRNDNFQSTLLALVVTLLLSLTWPLAIGTVGWMLRASGSFDNFIHALGQGLIAVAIMFLMLGVFIDMCRTHGLFIAHFGWSAQGTKRLARALRLLLLAIAPAALLTEMTNASTNPTLIDGIGRLGFIIGSLALALFLYRVFRPYKGALTAGLDKKRWVERTRGIWSNVLIAIPLLLAGLSATGYYASARELQNRLFTSGWIVLAVVIVFYVAMRGVLVASRRTAWQQADANFTKLLAAGPKRTESGESSEELNAQNQEPEIDTVVVSQQTRALLRAISGVVLAVLLWGIWSGLVPALNIFNDVALWSQIVSTSNGDKVTVVTLSQVLLSLLMLMLTFIAARNLPGFLELTLLQRLEIDSGTRYAIRTIGRYLIVGIGLIWAFNHAGADWSQLKWIVAALGVGLGFGLQEIVANFISGLIILFERPVRVGDLVSIGPTTGTVSRIKIRAITITDFDNFEVIVPNKAFITESVQNWSLTSPVTRLLIKVGVAYGSDVELTQKILLDVATANPRVMTTPAPSAFFMNFGDSSLDFELRVYVDTIERRLSTQHELHVALAAALKQAGIEIPFPQRDLHLRFDDTSRQT